MSTFNPINPNMNQPNDTFIDLINELKERDIPKFTFSESVKLSMFETEHQMIKQERDDLIGFCNLFYTQLNNKTLQEMIYELNQWEIRLKRMLCILNPKFHVTNGFNKTTNKSYRLLKGYWIDDQNQKKRIFNKGVGISDLSNEFYNQFMSLEMWFRYKDIYVK